MRPISLRMLTCSATLYTEQSKDADRNIVWSEPVELSKIYLTVTDGTTNTSDGKEPSDNMTMFYDCQNSLPHGLTFKNGSKVVFNDRDYFINGITPCYADGLHHYEIGLI